jgi:hypothetical protein
MTEPQPDYARPGMPSWQAPIIGAVVVILFGLRLAGQMERPITAQWVVGSAVAGALIGVLVGLCDGPGPGTWHSRPPRTSLIAGIRGYIERPLKSRLRARYCFHS